MAFPSHLPIQKQAEQVIDYLNYLGRVGPTGTTFDLLR